MGLFGTVSAIVAGTSATSTIVLDSGEVVVTNPNTTFVVSGVDAAGLDDINVGDRLAIVAVEDEGLVALDVLVIPDEPVTSIHVLGVVTAAAEGVITLTNDQGNTSTITVPAGTVVNLGDFVTLIASPDEQTDTLAASEIADIDDVIERLAEDIEEAVGESLAILQELLETNGDGHLTALLNALDEVSDAVETALEAALETVSDELEEKYQTAGLEGPFVRVEGFVTAIDVVGGVGTATIATVDGDELAFSIVGATDIEDTIVVGDFVKAKFNLDLQAKSIEIERDELTIRA